MNSVKIKSIKSQTLTLIGNMNGSQFEVYALLGKVYGSGCLLGYLLLSSNDGHPGGKECYLTMFLKYFKKSGCQMSKLHLPIRTSQRLMPSSQFIQRQSINSVSGTVYKLSSLVLLFLDVIPNFIMFLRRKRNLTGLISNLFLLHSQQKQIQ